MEVQTPGQAFAAFLGALGFTRPVEQLELRSVPLPSLLFWLSRPKCSNLVEATTQAEEVEDDISLSVDGHSSVRRDAVQGQLPSSGSWPRVHAALPATGTIQCSLHESL